MTVMFAPYLNFDGNWGEAFEFYHSVLGGELFVMSNDDMPPDDRLGPEWSGRTVYAALTIGDAVLMPLAETFFAARFGSLVDLFGTPWMINCERADPLA